MMAFGKDVDGIDLAHAQGIGKHSRVKVGPNRITFQCGVKVQVNLAITVVSWLHSQLLSKI
jgi:hypothetical protein